MLFWFLVYLAMAALTAFLAALTWHPHCDERIGYIVYGNTEFFLAGLFWPVLLPIMMVGWTIDLAILIRDQIDSLR